jgi:hypothetical protein
MNIKEFGLSIQAKHPEYKDMAPEEIGQKVLAKYPQYQDMVQSKSFKDKFVETGWKAIDAIDSGVQKMRDYSSTAGKSTGLSGLMKRGVGGLVSAGDTISDAQKRAGEGLTTAAQGVKEFDPMKTFQGTLGIMGGAGQALSAPAMGAFGTVQPEVENAVEQFKMQYQSLPEGIKKPMEKAANKIGENVPEDVRKMWGNALWSLGMTSVPGTAKITQGAIDIAKEGGAALKSGLKPVINAVSSASTAASSAMKYPLKVLIQKETGLNPETLKTAFSPKTKPLFDSAMKGEITRESLQSEVRTAFKIAKRELGESGKAYDAVRAQTTNFMLPKTQIDDLLTKKGLAINKNGKIVELKSNSSNFAPKDLTDLNNSFSLLKNPKGQILKSVEPNSYLNIRNKLDGSVNWKSGVNKNSEGLVKQIRGIIDGEAKKTIPGLNQIDATFAPQKHALDQFKKDFFDSFGNLKDGSAAKIVGLAKTSKGPEILARLEEFSPGITYKIRALSAYEDVIASGAQKVGTYTQKGFSMLLGAGAGSLAGQPIIGALIGFSLSSPGTAIKLLNKFGGKWLFGEKAAVTIVGKISQGVKLTNSEIQAVKGASNMINATLAGGKTGFNKFMSDAKSTLKSTKGKKANTK